MAKEYGMYYNQSMKFLQKKRSKIIYFLLLLTAFLLGGCSSHKEYVSASTTIRDNTPVCLVPAADGITVCGNELASLDASHTEDGYVMAAWHGEHTPVKLFHPADTPLFHFPRGTVLIRSAFMKMWRAVNMPLSFPPILQLPLQTKWDLISIRISI